MSQIQRIGDQLGCRTVGDAERTPQLRRSKIPNSGCPVPTQPDGPFGSGKPALCDGVAGMEVGPVRRKLQPADLGCYESVLVGLNSGQCGGRIQLGEVIFEHTFNISVGTDTDQPIR